MRKGLLYLVAGLLLAAIAAVAWSTLEYQTEQRVGGPYTVQLGDTIGVLSTRFGVTAAELANANGTTSEQLRLVPNDVIQVPPPSRSRLEVWQAHVSGAGAGLLGVLVGFWLALLAGLLPAGVRKQVLGIAVVLALASYAANQSVSADDPIVTPQHVANLLTGGFVWPALFAMMARALGIRPERPREPVTSEPAPVDEG